MTKEERTEASKISKNQIKKEMEILRHHAKQLTTIPEEELHHLEDIKLVEAVKEAKKIHKGNAKKRQIQYITKLIRDGNIEAVQHLVELYDSSSKTHIARFHHLETLRDRLMNDTKSTLSELIELHPDMDRQALRHLVKQAIKERSEEKESLIYYRKLFQFLKALDEISKGPLNA